MLRFFTVLFHYEIANWNAKLDFLSTDIMLRLFFLFLLE